MTFVHHASFEEGVAVLNLAPTEALARALVLARRWADVDPGTETGPLEAQAAKEDLVELAKLVVLLNGKEEVARLREELREVNTAKTKAEERVVNQTDWYHQRFNRLRRWVNEELMPLSAGLAHEYFAIIANGSPAPHESADWADTLHRWRTDCGVAERARARAEAALAAELVNGDTQRKAKETWESFAQENNRLRRATEDKLNHVRALISTLGCDCDCDHDALDEHVEDCEQCLACKLRGALT